MCLSEFAYSFFEEQQIIIYPGYFGNPNVYLIVLATLYTCTWLLATLLKNFLTPTRFLPSLSWNIHQSMCFPRHIEIQYVHNMSCVTTGDMQCLISLSMSFRYVHYSNDLLCQMADIKASAKDIDWIERWAKIWLGNCRSKEIIRFILFLKIFKNIRALRLLNIFF